MLRIERDVAFNEFALILIMVNRVLGSFFLKVIQLLTEFNKTSL